MVAEGAGARSLAEHWVDPGPSAAQKPYSNCVVQTAALAVLGNQSPPPGRTGLLGRIAPRPLLGPIGTYSLSSPWHCSM